MKMKFSVGIDEAGRGPLAGPITLAALCLPAGFRKLKFDFSIKDSKQMTKDRRAVVFKILKELRRDGAIDFSVSHMSSSSVDRYGITRCTRKGIARCLKKLGSNPADTKILLDGTLYAPEQYGHQRTIIRGDEKVKIISLASIIAKETRDRKMANFAKKYPQYGLEIHKGYGTKAHRLAIKKHGPSEIHRRSFIKNP